MNEKKYGIYDDQGDFLRMSAGVEQIDDCKPGEYKVPLRVCSGSSLSKAVFNRFKMTMYPSLNFSSKHSTKNTIGAFVVNLQGVVSSRDQSVVNYQLLIDSRSFAETPQVFVLSPKCENIEHENIFRKGRYSILPEMEICVLSTGPGFSESFIGCRTEKEKLGFLLHHVEDVLKIPIPVDAVRL